MAEIVGDDARAHPHVLRRAGQRRRRRLSKHAVRLEDRVIARTAQLEEARVEILERLALAAEYRDDETGEHTQRVGRESAALAQAMGLSKDEVEDIRKAAPLHDVGKIAIPDRILLKATHLDEQEFVAHYTGRHGPLVAGLAPVIGPRRVKTVGISNSTRSASTTARQMPASPQQASRL